ncbi:MAG: S8 family peptidase [Desulfurococcaceae archaeon]
MRKFLVCLAIVFVLISVLIPTFAEARPASIRLIIGVDLSGDYLRAKSVIESLGSVVLEIPEISALVTEVSPHLLGYLKSLSFVKYVEEDKPIKTSTEVQWNVGLVEAPEVWALNTTYGDAAYGYQTSIRVAVVDTGISYTHTDLYGSIDWCVVSLRNTKTFYKGTNLKNCNDQNGHGTHVAGIIAARLNGFGVAGVAPKVVLYAVRVLDASGGGYVSDVAKGIVEATKGPDNTPGTSDDADVISMSLGGPHSQTLYDAILYAYSYNVVLVAAAGNEGASTPSCPACYSEVIAVGAIDQNLSVPSWSNKNPDLVAPGVNILSTWPRNRYVYLSGTSMSCPHVSAIVALMQAIRIADGKGKLTPTQVKEILTTTAIDLGTAGYDETYGYGLVNAVASVNEALNTP